MASKAYVLILVPVFITIECTRFAHFAVLTAASPPPAWIPTPILLLARAMGGAAGWVAWALCAWVLWVPVRAVLWICGIGRDGAYRQASAAATARWYASRKHLEKEEVQRSMKLLWYGMGSEA
ncbi:hypothetical protein V8B97DRAFT_1914746 [Scleroderma yunnanense]